MLRLSVAFVPTMAPKPVRRRRVIEGLGFLRYRMTKEIPRSLPKRSTIQYSIRLTARERKRFMFCQELKPIRRCGIRAPIRGTVNSYITLSLRVLTKSDKGRSHRFNHISHIVIGQLGG